MLKKYWKGQIEGADIISAVLAVRIIYFKD